MNKISTWPICRKGANAPGYTTQTANIKREYWSV